MYGNYVVIAESKRAEQMQALRKQGKSVLREPSRLQKGFILICF